MADVLIVCVREDEVKAKALADLFEREGFSVGGAPGDEAALRASGSVIIVWSQSSIRSRPFLDAAQRAVSAGKAVIACLIDPPPASSLNQSPAFDLRDWDGSADSPDVDSLFFAVDRMVNAQRGGHPAPAAAAAAADPRAFAPQPPAFQAPVAPMPAQSAPPPYAARPAPRAPAPPAYAPPPQAPAFAPPQQPQAYAPQPAAFAPPQQPAPFQPPRPAPAPYPPQPYHAAQAQPQPAAYAPEPAPAPAAAPARGRRGAMPDDDGGDPMSAEALRWRAIRHSRDPAAFLHYLAEYGPNGAFSELAEIRLKQLQEANATPLKAAAKRARQPEAPQPPSRRELAEQRRQAATERQREEERAREAAEIAAAKERERRDREARALRSSPVNVEAGREPAPAAREPSARLEPRASVRGAPIRERRIEADDLDYRRPRRAERASSGGGALRFVFVFACLGAVAVGAGMYFGAGPRFLQSSPSLSAEAMNPAVADATPDTLSGEELASLDPSLTPAPVSAEERQVAGIGGPSAREEMAFDTTPARAALPPAPPPRAAAARPAPTVERERPREREREPVVLTGPRAYAASNPADAVPLLPTVTPAPPPAPAPSAAATPAAATAPAMPTPAPLATPTIARQGAIVWALRPTEIMFTSAYPDAARRMNLDGRVRLDCTVRSDLGVDCRVSSESPAGFGFGAAALRVVRGYRARGALSDGASAVGANTNITIAFRAGG